MPSRDLKGAVVAVVGANGGLGQEIAAALTSRGALVVRCTRSGGPDSDVTIDLRDSRSGDVLVEYVNATSGRLDGVVVAAGIVAFGDLVDTDDVVIEELFLTNAMGPMWLAKRVAPLLQASQGFLVNLSGVVAETPVPGMAAYSASKAAAAAATEAVRREFRRMKVTVVDARPPHTETGLATRPLAGAAPKMPAGLEPAAVAQRVVTAIEQGDTSVASTDF
ncbi:MAG TPA: SDR family oxidoreductase [Ilumatobacteraceae bacterium]|nr:SDR family oxidoreductase [Ilumatobacteraceae bacterium]